MIHVEHHLLRDGSIHLGLAGEIDDEFDGEMVQKLVQEAKSVVLHLGLVRNISSVGVRHLDNLVNGFAPRPVSMIHISPAIAAQLIMIPGLCGNASVETAKLPFRCASCGAESMHSVPWKQGAH